MQSTSQTPLFTDRRIAAPERFISSLIGESYPAREGKSSVQFEPPYGYFAAALRRPRKRQATEIVWRQPRRSPVHAEARRIADEAKLSPAYFVRDRLDLPPIHVPAAVRVDRASPCRAGGGGAGGGGGGAAGAWRWGGGGGEPWRGAA